MYGPNIALTKETKFVTWQYLPQRLIRAIRRNAPAMIVNVAGKMAALMDAARMMDAPPMAAAADVMAGKKKPQNKHRQVKRASHKRLARFLTGSPCRSKREGLASDVWIHPSPPRLTT